MSILQIIASSPTLALTLAGVLGLCVGSFLNVVIYRTPVIMQREWRKEIAWYLGEQTDFDQNHVKSIQEVISKDTPFSLSYPPSTCPNCGHQIRAYENIPIISWLLILRAKCAGCKNPISSRYPLVELITCLLSVLMVYVLGANIAGLLALPYLWILIALTGIDFDTQLLPDRLVYPLGGLGLFANSFAIFTTPILSIYGLIFGFLSLWIVAKIYALITKKDGMGGGDFKLLGAIGAWIGLPLMPAVIFISAILGSVIGLILMSKHGKSKPFAFGPYIAIAGVIAMLWGSDIMHWYFGMYK